ncbi:MAG: argininosuccinate lyase [Myxococcota bacterium]|nr:argininosuccinate lyase [Myxococcota bacterium]
MAGDVVKPEEKSGGQSTWGGRFSEATDALVARMNASVSFDQRLYREDIAGSRAHAEMLASCGILSAAEQHGIDEGLQKIQREIEGSSSESENMHQWSWAESLEDVHMNIEGRLREMIGDAGGKLHTARSRNDQVATDLRLWLMQRIDQQCTGYDALIESLLSLAEANQEAVMPGYTHLQRAQPVLFAHHLLAYCEMIERDRARLVDCRRRCAESPLGAAALAGTPFPIDRGQTARRLGFESVMRNSLDAVASRDFAVEFTSAAAIAMVHLSRLCEELILWSSQEFAFIELGDAFATGSSIMPQKKNPDIPELVRGKSGRVIGDLVSLLTTLKGLPLAYNKDLQEDKEALFDAVDTLADCVQVMSKLLPACQVNREAMRRACDAGFVTATDVADYLANKGVPFRAAHHVVGGLVRWCIEEQRTLTSLSLEEFQRFSADFDKDILEAVTVESSLSARESYGGTSPAQVIPALGAARARLEARQ